MMATLLQTCSLNGNFSYFRIHKHRSFHCDICGVCLDVQLRDNHKCRAGSAHDECCICLEVV